MKNQKARAKYQGRVMSELRELPPDLQDQAFYHLHIRIKELREESNTRSHKSTDNWTRDLL